MSPNPASDPDDARRDAERERVQRAFGVVLRRLRDGRGLSQEDLAAESGVGRSFIAKLELGRTQPTLTTLFRLSRALETPAEAVVAAVSAEAVA